MERGYDHQNIFAQIIRGEKPCKKVWESPHSLCFHDVAPKAKVHLLLLPKGPFTAIDLFALHASDEEILDLFLAIPQVMKSEKEWHVKINTRAAPLEKQVVPHLHLHLLSGRGETLDREKNRTLTWGTSHENVLKAVRELPAAVKEAKAESGFNLLLQSGQTGWRLDF